MVEDTCDYCKRTIYNSSNFIYGPNGLKVAVHKMHESKWRAKNKVDTYKFFTAKDKCTKCGESLRRVHTFCHDCGRCPSCFTKWSKCNKVVLLGNADGGKNE